jgi:hypothetical protein
VQVREKDSGELGEPNLGRTENLVLRALATIDEPPLPALGQVQGAPRHVARPTRRTRSCS